jgi:hypothetical protein
VLALALEDCDRAEEEDAGGDGHKDNGVAVSGLGLGWCGCCVVTALGAALRVGWKSEHREEEQGSESDAFHSVPKSLSAFVERSGRFRQ